MSSLLVVMLHLGVFIANSHDYGSVHSGARTLSSVKDLTEDNWLFTSFLIALKWAVHAVIVAAVLVRIFVFGEPVTRPHSENAVLFWRHRNQADIDLSKVQLS